MELFPDSSVVFKQHRLIHYPNVLRASGPFVYQSVLRYERKHQFFKRLTHNICNFKNICKSLSLRHQICQFNDWRHSPPFKKHDFPGSSVKHLSTVFDSDFDYKNFFGCDEALVSKHAVIRGTRYSTNDVLISSVSSDSMPIFELVIFIVVNRSQVYFICERIVVKNFDSSSRSYTISKQNLPGKTVVPYRDLFDFHPLSRHSCFVPGCSFLHICLRHKLRFNNFAEMFDSMVSE